MSDQPIRVWLEPGYDYGRTGAWMLDLPGCFTWADDRATVLAAVPAALAGFISLLDRHGEPDFHGRPPDGGTVEVVAEVAATWQDN